MKQIEYFYNVIYYFFYRATIKLALFVRGRYNPLIFILYLFYNIPYIKNEFKKKGIDDPLAWHLGYDKKIEETSIANPKVSVATMIGAGFAEFTFLLFYIGIYNIVKYFLFPSFEDNFAYVLTVTVILAFLTDVLFSQISGKGVKYIKKFNKKKGWWRIKWKIITISSLFLTLWFTIETSSSGRIGKYLISLHN